MDFEKSYQIIIKMDKVGECNKWNYHRGKKGLYTQLNQ
jgi:hypothetical protein